MLADRDDWASGAPPTSADLLPLFKKEKLTLREAMHCLKNGAVADYFAFRRSDPTFLGGLCLLENHLARRAKTVFELCCGIGHYLREFALRNIDATGADAVFSKLWLARKFVAPDAKLHSFAEKVEANYRVDVSGFTIVSTEAVGVLDCLRDRQIGLVGFRPVKKRKFD